MACALFHGGAPCNRRLALDLSADLWAGVVLLVSRASGRCSAWTGNRAYLAEIEARDRRRSGGPARVPYRDEHSICPSWSTGVFDGRVHVHVVVAQRRGGRLSHHRAVADRDGRRSWSIEVLSAQSRTKRPAQALRRDRQPASGRDEVDEFTPDPREANIWFARDVPAMAAACGPSRCCVVARRNDANVPTPLPIDTARYPQRSSAIRDHLVRAGLDLGGDDSDADSRITRPRPRF